ncbi:T9SS type A sorting domain-containing protein [Flavobacterium sp.]|uniref:T9SS type A sorting domain-containing protein n=1 Tax=Flavobacterium sp. TaxID=239 RepID=UPI002869EE85|nr:T9SS type A sorting domain-containing protein [Flavobacterium sp.]
MDKHLLTVMMLFAVFSIHAQKSAGTAGGDASGKSGTAAYSVGQTSYTSDLGSRGSTSQGVQHAYEIFKISDSKHFSDAHFSMYPNPTEDIINIDVGNFETKNLSYQLYDIAGKLQLAGKLAGQTTSVALKGFPTGTYVVRLLSGEQSIQTFKIIKNQ